MIKTGDLCYLLFK